MRGSGEERGVAHVGVVIFGKHVEEAPVDVGFCGIELGDVGVLDPVDEHLSAEDEEEGGHYLADPVR